MMWKQPVPTQVPETMGDSFAETVYQKLVIRAKNERGNVYIKENPILLERGQCITGRYELAECFGLSKNQSGKIQRILVKLQKVYNLIDIRRHRYCSVITILNYDKVVLFEQLNEHLVDISWTSGRHLVDTNKSDKSNKSVERENSKLKPEEIFQLGKEFGLGEYEVKLEYQKYQNYWDGKQKNERTGFKNWLFKHLEFSKKKKPDLLTIEDKINDIPKSGPITSEQFDLLFEKAKGKRDDT